MDKERVTGALRHRALMWHKATSFYARPDYTKHMTTEVQESEGGKVTQVTPVQQTDARKAAKQATTKIRRSFWNSAIDAGRKLVDVLVEETVEQRPKPLESFWYNNQEYKLQSVEGETVRYVITSNYNENMVTLNPITHRERIKKEIITMREILASDMLTALTPTANTNDSETA